jgi:Mg-chelatase subunit ChlD
MPTCFFQDTRWAVVPWTWDDVAARSLRVREPEGASLGEVCGRSGEDESAGTWIGFASTETARRKSGDRVSVSAARVDLDDQSFVRLDLDVASMLADVPRDLATVLIVDGSRSLSVDDRVAQRALVASYLKKAPRSQVQVVSFARTAQALLPAWKDATRARASVEQVLRSVVPRNGSNFDAAFAEAATWLARTGGTRRVVLVTDQRMATRLASMSDVSLQRLLPAGTLIQVVVLAPGTGLTRDNEVRRGSLATLTGGIATTLGSDTTDAEVDATMLVRPVSVDRLEIVAPGWEPMSHEHGARSCTAGLDVVEGQACTLWASGRRPSVAPITVEGWVWGKRLMRVVTPERSHDVDVARELSMSGGLTDDLRTRVDTRARAVNSTWSLYATWGGTEGYDAPGGGGTGWGTICGCGSVGTIGHGFGTGTGYDREPALDLRAQLVPALGSCNLGDGAVTVAVELTNIEIADVHVTARNLPTAERQRVEACVAEVVWASSPTIPRPRDHQIVSFTVAH